MYQIVYTKHFEKALSRLVKGGLKKSTQKLITETIDLLASGVKLDAGTKIISSTVNLRDIVNVMYRVICY